MRNLEIDGDAADKPNRREFLKYSTLLGMVAHPFISSAAASTGCHDERLSTWFLSVTSRERPPFSLSLHGNKTQLRPVTSRNEDKGDKQRTIIEFREANQPLTVLFTCEMNKDHSHVRSFIRLSASKALTGTISDIAILDLSIADGAQATTHLRGLSGGFVDAEISRSEAGTYITTMAMPPASLKPWDRQLRVGESFSLDSDRSGRSSNSQVPIWLYGDAEGGYWCGPEWSGCWRFDVRRSSTGSMLSIGLPTFDFKLAEGEQLELPAAVFGTYAGNLEQGCNQLRQTILTRLTPLHEGRRATPKVIFQGLHGLPTYQDEATLYAEADRAGDIGCEAFVLDAGWNQAPDTRNWSEGLGNWEPSPKRFPNGFKKFVDHVHAKGMKLGIWIEPRAALTSKAYQDNPGLYVVPGEAAFDPAVEFYAAQPLWAGLYTNPSEKERAALLHGFTNQAMLDLSQKKAQSLLLAQLEGLVALGADWIWFDFNIDPRLTVWAEREQQGREGRLELAFYQGLYSVLDEFHERHPRVWLETCAAGGRMIDLGILRRSHSIWINDVSEDEDITRNLRGGANTLLPAGYIQSGLFLTKDITAKPPEKPTSLGGAHRILSGFGGALQFGQGLCYWREDDLREAKRYVDAYKKYRRYLENDYYRVLPMPENRAAWDGWQYDDPSNDSGILVVFRMKDNLESDQLIRPKRTNELRNYRWSVILGDAAVELQQRGLKVSMSAPSSALIHYTRA